MLTSIIPDPLHPAIVHLPMALVVLLPLTVAIALWVIHRGGSPLRVWSIAAALHATLVLSAWASLASGNQAGERVEDAVAEAPLESHEEAAEAFLMMSVAALAVSLVGLRRDRVGVVARGVAGVGTLVLFGAGWQVGHSGGQLVYTHGAASVYTKASARSADSRLPSQRAGERGTDDR